LTLDSASNRNTEDEGSGDSSAGGDSRRRSRGDRDGCADRCRGIVDVDGVAEDVDDGVAFKELVDDNGADNDVGGHHSGASWAVASRADELSLIEENRLDGNSLSKGNQPSKGGERILEKHIESECKRSKINNV